MYFYEIAGKIVINAGNQIEVPVISGTMPEKWQACHDYTCTHEAHTKTSANENSLYNVFRKRCKKSTESNKNICSHAVSLLIIHILAYI